MSITIVGLGPGDPDLITRRAWEVLSSAQAVYLRTRLHPCVPALPPGPVYHSFDDLYEASGAFEEVYAAIVERLTALAEQGVTVVYAVPGDPMVAESSVRQLLAVCEEKRITCAVVSGVSFIEPALALLGVDAAGGLQLLDALDVAAAHHPPINPDYPALLAQVYSRAVASDVKLTLMNQYPDDHPVALVHGAGTPSARLERLPLYEIDRREVGNLTALYVPRFDPDPAVVTGFEGFQNTMAHLRAPEGCPWDREQTHRSLLRYLLEEAYEFVDAVEADDPERIREELGDLLLQVIFHAQVAVEEGEFYMPEVVRTIDAKLKRRHPHVWGDVDVKGSAEQVTVNWEAIKAQERAENGEPGRASLLDGVPRALPALEQAHLYDSRAAKVGFDWPDMQGAVDKVREEFAEVLAAATPEERFSEIGDLLFVVSVLARWMKVEPEAALRAANRRFYDRFSYIERRAREQGRELTGMTLDEMDALWNEAKRSGIGL